MTTPEDPPEYPLEGIVSISPPEAQSPIGFIPVLGPVLEELAFDGKSEPSQPDDVIRKLHLFSQKLSEAGIRALIPTGQVEIIIGKFPGQNNREKKIARIHTYLGIKA